MIRLNGLSTVNFISRPAFKAEEAPVEKSMSEYKETTSLDGIQALASYNFNIINKAEKFDEIKPVALIYKPGDNIEGDKIYDSEGKLNSIVKEDEETRTVYIPDESDENLISNVKVIDKNRGNIIKEQENEIEDGKYTGFSWIGEYSPKDGKLLRTTSWQDDKADHISMSKYYKDGGVSVSRDNCDSEYYVSYDSDKYRLGITLDNDKRPRSFWEEKKLNHVKTVSTEASFYNGNLISASQTKTVTMPNSLGREVFNNNELSPAKKYVPQIDLKGYKGEKSYYSNNVIEKNIINDGETTAFFNPDGSLKTVKTGNKEISFDERGSQEIVEDLGEGKTKITKYYEDGDGYVELKTKDDIKTVWFDKNKRPESFSLSALDEKGEETNYSSLYYNDIGMLEDTYNC